MGMFYIYSLQNSDEIYNSITFSNPHYVYIDPDNYYDLEKIEIKCKTQILNNFWDNFICAELLPNKIIIHYGALFENKFEMQWDAAREWIYEKGYIKPNNLILKECFSCIQDVVDGVNYFCDMVAKTKATQFLLMGYANSTNFSN